MRATQTFTDRNGVTHRNGEEWLIKMEDTEAHIPDVYEEVCTLSLSQYFPRVFVHVVCIIYTVSVCICIMVCVQFFRVCVHLRACVCLFLNTPLQ